MGAVEKLVNRYWVDVLGVLRGPRASSLQSFRSSFLHPLSFISIVAKSAEKANFAILRCGKWALWKNWSIDIELMYWGCSGDLGHHPCKVSDPHPLSFISIVGQKVLKKQILPYYGAANGRCGKTGP